MTPSVDYSKWLKRLDTQLNNKPIKIIQKSPNLLSQGIRQLYYKNLETCVKNIPMSPP